MIALLRQRGNSAASMTRAAFFCAEPSYMYPVRESLSNVGLRREAMAFRIAPSPGCLRWEHGHSIGRALKRAAFFHRAVSLFGHEPGVVQLFREGTSAVGIMTV